MSIEATFRGRHYPCPGLYSVACDPVSPQPFDPFAMSAEMTAKSNSETLVTVYGGSGFLGRHVVRALARRGYLVRVAVRRPDLAFHLQPLGRVGQIHAVQANLRHAPSVDAAARDASVLINLVGILYERGRQRFDAVHVYGAEQVALAASAHGARAGARVGDRRRRAVARAHTRGPRPRPSAWCSRRSRRR